MNKEKKKRSQNWDSTDKLILRKLIEENISAIENKNVDTDTSKQKREAWNAILESFNKVSIVKRDVDQIKCQWRCSKLLAKTSVSKCVMRNESEEGSPLKRTDSEVECLVEPQEFEVDCNPFDCDAVELLDEVKVQIEDDIDIVGKNSNRKRKTTTAPVCPEEMKVAIFDITMKAKEKQMYFMEIEHKKKMETLELKKQFLEAEERRKLEAHTMQMQVLMQKNGLDSQVMPLRNIRPDATLYDAIQILIRNRIHQLPVIDPATGNVLYILTHKRILRFLFLHNNELPKQSFMQKKLCDLKIDSYYNIESPDKHTSNITALKKSEYIKLEPEFQ